MAAEYIEERGLVVTTALDVVDEHDGMISLREAILYANSGTRAKDGSATITFDTSLGNEINIAWAGSLGNIDITSGIYKNEVLTIDGLERVTITGEELGDGFIYICSNNSVVVKNMNFTGHNMALGGSIVFNQGTLLADNCSFTSNDAMYSAGIFNQYGVVTIQDCYFADNSVTKNSGAVRNEYGTMLIEDSYFINNHADRNGGAIQNVFANANLTIKNTVFDGNSASTGGGAIYNYDKATISLNGCTFVDNSANYGFSVWNGASSSTSTKNSSFYGDNTDAVLAFKVEEAGVGVDEYILTATWKEVAGVSHVIKIDDEIVDVDSPNYSGALTIGKHDIYVGHRDGNNNYAWSAMQSFTVRDATLPVLDGLPNIIAANENGVTITWNPASDNIGVAGYNIWLDGVKYEAQGTRITITDLAKGSYSYRLEAYDADGNSAWSATQSFDFPRMEYLKTFQAELSGTSAVTCGTAALNPGSYSLKGNFAAGLNASITVVDKASGKTVMTATVKNGLLTQPKDVLLNGDYAINITSADKGKTTGSATVELVGSVYTKANQAADDVWGLSPAIAHGETVDEWVGFGDKIDYRKLELDANGSYDFTISALGNTAKITVWTVNAAGTGLTAVKSVTVTPKYDKQGNLIAGSDSGGIRSFLLDQSTQYYVSVEATGAATGKNTTYNLEFGGTKFAPADKTDDTVWQVRENAASNNISDWVGYGDLVDWHKLDIAANGRYSFGLTGVELGAGVAMTVYSLIGNKLTSVGNVSVTGKVGVDSAALKNLLLSKDVDYYVEVKSTTGTKGLNTGYTVTGSADKTYGAITADNTISTAASWQEENTGWVGYGDVTDYYRLTLTDSGMYGFTLTDVAIKGAVKVTVYRAYDDNKSGNADYQPLQQIVTGSATAAAVEGKFSITLASKELLAGTYYVKVETADVGSDSKNSDYTLVMSGTAYGRLDSGDRIEAKLAVTRTIQVSGFQKLEFTTIGGLSLYMDNGKNGRTTLAPVLNKASGKYEIILATGTYYLASSGKNTAASEFTMTPSSDYAGAIVTADNSWKNAVALSDNASGWVGYGDAADFYAFTVAKGEAGAYNFALSDAVTGNVKLTLYRVATDAKGVQSLVSMGSFTYSEGKKTALDIANLLDGTYYVAIESPSAGKAVGAKNSGYTLAVTSTAYAIPDGMGEVTLGKNEYAQFVTGGSADEIYRLDMTGKSYAVYVNNGSNGFRQLAMTNGSVYLAGGTAYYLKSTIVANSLESSITQADTVDCNWDGTFSDAGNNRLASGDITGWVGLNNSFDEYFFDAAEGGWVDFQLTGLENTLDVTTKITLELYREVNGSWAKVTGVASSLNYNAQTGEFSLSAPTLGASLVAGTDYKLLVKTSDNGKGVSTGNYTIEGAVDRYDFTNNTLADATSLAGASQWDATVTQAGDKQDFYDLADWQGMSLDVDQGGSVKLTFYDENYNVVKVSGALNGKTSLNSAFMVNGATGDPVEFQAFDLAMASFIKIEAVGTANNHYQLAVA